MNAPRSAEKDAGLFSAIERAESDALVLHQRGECHLSEWSCSHCESGAEANQADTEQHTPPLDTSPLPTECPMVTVKATQCPHDVCWQADTCQANTCPTPPEQSAP